MLTYYSYEVNLKWGGDASEIFILKLVLRKNKLRLINGVIL